MVMSYVKELRDLHQEGLLQRGAAFIVMCHSLIIVVAVIYCLLVINLPDPLWSIHFSQTLSANPYFRALTYVNLAGFSLATMFPLWIMLLPNVSSHLPIVRFLEATTRAAAVGIMVSVYVVVRYCALPDARPMIPWWYLYCGLWIWPISFAYSTIEAVARKIWRSTERYGAKKAEAA
jgi:hypothetical protein